MFHALHMENPLIFIKKNFIFHYFPFMHGPINNNRFKSNNSISIISLSQTDRLHFNNENIVNFMLS